MMRVMIQMNNYNIIEFDRLDSTNKYMKENLDRLSPFDIVRAVVQTSGYGRMQRSWYDNSDNLSFSMYLKTKKISRLGQLPQLAAVSVVSVLNEYGVEAKIKWPNDVLVDGKKICGILVETVLTKDTVSVILGIGLNVNNQYFTDDLKQKATSIYQQKGKLYDMRMLLNNLATKLTFFFNQFESGDATFMQVARDESFLIGKEVMLYEGDVVRVTNIDDTGRLVVIKNGKEQTYSGSEVSLQNIYNS